MSGDILEISVDLEKLNRFGREEEYFHLLGFKIEWLIKVEQLKQEIFSLISEISNAEEKLRQLEKIKGCIDTEIEKVKSHVKK